MLDGRSGEGDWTCGVLRFADSNMNALVSLQNHLHRTYTLILDRTCRGGFRIEHPRGTSHGSPLAKWKNKQPALEEVGSMYLVIQSYM